MPALEEELKSRFESEQHKALLNVLFTANWFKGGHAPILAAHDLSLQQYNILRILRGAKGRMNMHQVKCRMLDRAPNATRLTDKLITKGLVERVRCEEDRRVVYVSITTKGLDLLEEVDLALRPALAEKHARLSKEDAHTLNRILDDLRG
ncbi:MAG: MarR family transcriptional regulator [Flavobacteriales bacterium]|nr:MarR family transcriptional regulator [Flavobacteriales bacterium]MBK7941416.1 MarR family transcriptional regulator [Flavobacteriales bacterium]MBK8949161.1 MarR family transcriptional regulator [Flavobacteriales bacterium]MBK9701485.1 MarR family transcriptional regulator [Flavobacteriales bacterium]